MTEGLTPEHDICLLHGNGCQHETEFATAAAGTQESRIHGQHAHKAFDQMRYRVGQESMTNYHESHGEGHNHITSSSCCIDAVRLDFEITIDCCGTRNLSHCTGCLSMIEQRSVISVSNA